MGARVVSPLPRGTPAAEGPGGRRVGGAPPHRGHLGRRGIDRQGGVRRAGGRRRAPAAPPPPHPCRGRPMLGVGWGGGHARLFCGPLPQGWAVVVPARRSGRRSARGGRDAWTSSKVGLSPSTQGPAHPCKSPHPPGVLPAAADAVVTRCTRWPRSPFGSVRRRLSREKTAGQCP